ncbi:unnamed protein product [Withania somnifera]
MGQHEVLDVLFQNGLDISLEEKNPDSVGEEDWKIINHVACGTTRSFLAREHEYSYTKETSPSKLWNALEDKCLKKNNMALMLLTSLPDEYEYLETTLLYGNDEISLK